MGLSRHHCWQSNPASISHLFPPFIGIIWDKMATSNSQPNLKASNTRNILEQQKFSCWGWLFSLIFAVFHKFHQFKLAVLHKIKRQNAIYHCYPPSPTPGCQSKTQDYYIFLVGNPTNLFETLNWGPGFLIPSNPQTLEETPWWIWFFWPDRRPCPLMEGFFSPEVSTSAVRMFWCHLFAKNLFAEYQTYWKWKC